MNKLISCAAGATLLIASTANAQSTVCEDFEGGMNPGWTAGPFGAPVTYEAAGGNPNGHLNAIDNGNNPEWYSPASGAYASNFRADGLNKISVDMREDDPTAAQFTVWLMLVNDPDPMVMFDETFAYVPNNANAISPPTGGGWFTYDFNIPSHCETAPVASCGGPGDPDNWLFFGGAGTDDDKWNAFMTGGTTQISFHVANNPVLGFDLLGIGWDYSIDNVCLEYLAPQAPKVDLCEDFEGGMNPGWTAGPFGAPVTYEAAGGNPNGFLNATDNGNNPEWYSPSSGIYASNFRASGVSHISVDLKEDDPTAGQFALWLMLVNDPDPMVMFDETFAFVLNDKGLDSPPVGGGWFTYDFCVPSKQTTSPTSICGPGSARNWQYFGGMGTDDDKWNAFMTGGTTQISFHVANNPVLGFDLLGIGWDYGIDNVCVSVDGGSAYSSLCNGDGGDQMGCTNCPCGNNSPMGTVGGCMNSGGTSTSLGASGSASVSLPAGDTSDLRFAASGMPATAFGVLLSDAAVGPLNMANPCFGLNSGTQAADRDGLRCIAGGAGQRHGGRTADANGDVGVTNNGWGGEFNPPAGIAGQSGFAAGQTRYFQLNHRDDASLVCMRGLNSSQAVEVTFTP